MPKKATKKLKSTTPTWLHWRMVVPLVLLIAIIGGYLVSRSYAATGWVQIASEYPDSSAYWTITTLGLKLDKASFVAGATADYRICFYGRSPSGTSRVNIQPTDFSTQVNVSGASFTRFCSKTTRIEKGSIRYTPHLFRMSGTPLEVQRVVVERL